MLLLSIIGHYSYSQTYDFRKSSIKTAIGVGFNEGHKETGIGILYSIGWQKSYGKKDKLRINPNMIIGSFMPILITDTRDQLYRITTLGVNAHYDVIRYSPFSLVVTGGVFINYSRGLLGTGGWPELNNNRSEYFRSIYTGVNTSMALRINSSKSRFAFELRPINIHIGNHPFVLGYMMFGVDFKLQKSKTNEDKE